jgi:aspartyl-tRNA(Asn)/glutamyl-tRNA(Gln) amidotransferase subunit A
MYLTDIYTVIANIVWLPAMSVPCGFINEEWVDLPVGFHIMTNHWREDMMFRVGRGVSAQEK